MKKADCTPEEWAAYLLRKRTQQAARKAKWTPEQWEAERARDRNRDRARSKSDYTPEAWAAIRAKARERPHKNKADYTPEEWAAKMAKVRAATKRWQETHPVAYADLHRKGNRALYWKAKGYDAPPPMEERHRRPRKHRPFWDDD